MAASCQFLAESDSDVARPDARSGCTPKQGSALIWLLSPVRIHAQRYSNLAPRSAAMANGCAAGKLRKRGHSRPFDNCGRYRTATVPPPQTRAGRYRSSTEPLPILHRSATAGSTTRLTGPLLSSWPTSSIPGGKSRGRITPHPCIGPQNTGLYPLDFLRLPSDECDA